MSTETVKRCDIYDTKRDVITVSVRVVELGEETEIQMTTAPETEATPGGFQLLRKIKDITLDVSPKALERLLACVEKGTTPPGGMGEG